MTRTVLILGAGGSFGSHAAQAFGAAGWQVRRFRRGDDLNRAAQGARAIVNGWNPPYPQWAAEVPGLTRAVIAAARGAGATVILPGNVYNFGAEAPEILGPDTPQAARNPLGRVRAEMEAAYRASGVRTIVLRAGDFIDCRGSGNWFDQVIAAKAARGIVTYPGETQLPHAWGYLPDLGRAAVALAEVDGLPVFADVPFPGFTLTGAELAQAMARVLGRPMALRRFTWPAIWAARPVWPMARGIWEMRYLWSKPHRLASEPFRSLLPEFRATALDTALAAALEVEVEPDKAVA